MSAVAFDDLHNESLLMCRQNGITQLSYLLIIADWCNLWPPSLLNLSYIRNKATVNELHWEKQMGFIEFMQRLILGDPVAQDSLCKRYFDALVDRARKDSVEQRLGLDPQELALDTIEYVLRSPNIISNVRTSQELDRLMYRKLRYLTIDVYRRQKVTQPPLLMSQNTRDDESGSNASLEDICASDVHVEDVLFTDWCLQTLQRAIRSLSVEEQFAFRHRFGKTMDWREAAAQIGLSKSNYYRQAQMAVENLRAILRPQGFFDECGRRLLPRSRI